MKPEILIKTYRKGRLVGDPFKAVGWPLPGTMPAGDFFFLLDAWGFDLKVDIGDGGKPLDWPASEEGP